MERQELEEQDNQEAASYDAALNLSLSLKRQRTAWANKTTPKHISAAIFWVFKAYSAVIAAQFLMQLIIKFNLH